MCLQTPIKRFCVCYAFDPCGMRSTYFQPAGHSQFYVQQQNVLFSWKNKHGSIPQSHVGTTDHGVNFSCNLWLLAVTFDNLWKYIDIKCCVHMAGWCCM